jgi:hypothetical protein
MRRRTLRGSMYRRLPSNASVTLSLVDRHNIRNDQGAYPRLVDEDAPAPQIFRISEDSLLELEFDALVHQEGLHNHFGESITDRIASRYPEAVAEYFRSVPRTSDRAGRIYVSALGEGRSPKYVFHFPILQDWATYPELPVIVDQIEHLKAEALRLGVRRIGLYGARLDGGWNTAGLRGMVKEAIKGTNLEIYFIEPTSPIRQRAD